MTKELLSQIANMELRDQLEAKEQMIKNLKEYLGYANSILKANVFIAKSDYKNRLLELIEKIEELLK